MIVLLWADFLKIYIFFSRFYCFRENFVIYYHGMREYYILQG